MKKLFIPFVPAANGQLTLFQLEQLVKTCQSLGLQDHVTIHIPAKKPKKKRRFGLGFLQVEVVSKVDFYP